MENSEVYLSDLRILFALLQGRRDKGTNGSKPSNVKRSEEPAKRIIQHPSSFNNHHHMQHGQLGARKPPFAKVMDARKSNCDFGRDDVSWKRLGIS